MRYGQHALRRRAPADKMTTGEKVGIGIAIVGAAGIITYLVWPKKASAAPTPPAPASGTLTAADLASPAFISYAQAVLSQWQAATNGGGAPSYGSQTSDQETGVADDRFQQTLLAFQTWANQNPPYNNPPIASPAGTLDANTYNALLAWSTNQQASAVT